MSLTELLRVLTDPRLARAVQAVPTVVSLRDAAARALKGDRAALEYLKAQGAYDVLDLVQPGAGAAAKQAAAAAKAFTASNVVDGEWRELTEEAPERYPWSRFESWIRRRRHGAFVVLGPRGGGKTVLAMRLAQIWHDETGWPAEVVNVYPDDAPDFVLRVSAKRFAERLKILSTYLDIDDYDGLDDESTESEGEPTAELVDISQFERRIVVIDEASLVGTSLGQRRGREMLAAIMAQTRHLHWMVVYIAQIARMIPVSLIGTADAVFLKRPIGGEQWADRPDDAEIGRLWERAAQGFDELRKSPYWAQAADYRRWTYVEVPEMGGSRSWQGMVPVSPPR